MHRFCICMIALLLLSASNTRAQQNTLLNLYDQVATEPAGDAISDWGYSVYIEYNGTVILFDFGTRPGVLRHNAQILGADLTKVDIAVVSHNHSDHIGGMRAVLDSFPVGKVMDSGMPHTTSTYRNFIQAIENKKIPYVVPKIGDTFSPAPGLDFLVLNAPVDNT